MDVPDMLRTYLQDHHAGSMVGVELSRRAAGANEESDYGAEISLIAEQIAEDRDTLERLMERLGVKPNRLKDAGGWTAEKLGRLKPNNSLLSYSPLSRVVELEGLVVGVTGKLALWESMHDVLGESVAGIDFVALAERASEQRSRLERLRRTAAVEAMKPQA